LPIAFILGWFTIGGLLLFQKLDKTIIDYPYPSSSVIPSPIRTPTIQVTPILSKSPPPAKVPNPTPAAQKTP
jgi:hypothetical protein